jgi:hypothetical protein
MPSMTDGHALITHPVIAPARGAGCLSLASPRTRLELVVYLGHAGGTQPDGVRPLRGSAVETHRVFWSPRHRSSSDCPDALEVERAPRDENSVLRDIDQIDEGLAVNFSGAHVPSMPSGTCKDPDVVDRWVGSACGCSPDCPMAQEFEPLRRSRASMTVGQTSIL